MFKDTHIYSETERALRRIVVQLFTDENYSIDEIFYLVERYIYAQLYCNEGLDTKSVAQRLGISETRVRKSRESYDFKYYTRAGEKTQEKILKKKVKEQGIEELQERVLSRLKKKEEQEK